MEERKKIAPICAITRTRNMYRPFPTFMNIYNNVLRILVIEEKTTNEMYFTQAATAKNSLSQLIQIFLLKSTLSALCTGAIFFDIAFATQQR